MTTALNNRIKSLSVRLADSLDLAIEAATLGGYGLEPVPGCGGSAACPERLGAEAPRQLPADAGCGQRDREVTWEVSTPARRGSCDRPVRLIDAYAGAFCSHP